MAEASDTGAQRNRGRSAPVHHIPTARIVALEHPGIVKNFDNGFKSLGGETQLKHVLEHRVGDSKFNNKQNEKPEPVAGVSLRPNDPLAKKIPSNGVDTQNVLVKVTLPKRTGRKRKRGSDEPFMEPSQPELLPTSIMAPDLLQRLRDNEGMYTVEAVGMLHETHRFRVLPDFQLHNADIPMMRHLRDHAMVPDYDRFKHFRVDMSSKSVRHTALPGPPSFTSIDMPHKFEYRQPDTIVFVQDDAGQLTTKNLSSAYKRFVTAFAPDVDEIPMQSPQEPPPFSTGGNELQKAVALLRKLLQERPIVTKRVILNSLPPMSETIFKEATQYAGYSFKAGPFRDSLIRYGVDPRKDPQYRFYQTLMFQLDNQVFKTNGEKIKLANKPGTDRSSLWARPLRHTRDDPNTHMFDGKTVTANGKTWQVCDVTDPLIHKIFHTDDIPTQCDVFTHGWFHNGTMAKARTIMKDKMMFLFAGDNPPEEDYERLAAVIPEDMPHSIFSQVTLDKDIYGDHASHLVGIAKNIAKTAHNAARRKQRLGDEELESMEFDLMREIDGGDDESVRVGEGDFEGEPMEDPFVGSKEDEQEGPGEESDDGLQEDEQAGSSSLL